MPVNSDEFSCTKCKKPLNHLHSKFFICEFCMVVFEKPIARNWDGDLISFKNHKKIINRNALINLDIESIYPDFFDAKKQKAILLDYEKTMRDGVLNE